MCKNGNHIVGYYSIQCVERGFYTENELYKKLKEDIDDEYGNYLYPSDYALLSGEKFDFDFTRKDYLDNYYSYYYLFNFCPECGEKLGGNKTYNRINKRLREYVLSLPLRTATQTAEIVKRRKALRAKPKKETKNQKDERYVYLIKMGEDYKIGISKDPERRLGEFTLLPKELEKVFIHKVSNAKLIESELHEIFDEKRVRGEWFNLNEEDIEFIKNYIKDNEVKI